MMAFLHGVWRLLVGGFAFTCAALAAGFVLGHEVGAVLQTWVMEQFDGAEADAFAETLWFVPSVAAALVIWVLGAIPVGMFIILSEIYRQRGILYYTLSGGLFALLGMILMANGLGGLGDVSGIGEIGMGTVNYFLASGFIGGLIYWLIAGRNAGFGGRAQ